MVPVERVLKYISLDRTRFRKLLCETNKRARYYLLKKTCEHVNVVKCYIIWSSTLLDMDNDIDKPQKKSAKHDSGAADLEKVTDYAEEREVLAQDISGAINLIDSRRNKEAAEKLAKERELAKVSIKKEDVEVLVNKGYTYWIFSIYLIIYFDW